MSLRGRPVSLTAIAYRILAGLSANAGRVQTYGHLLRRLWRLEGDAEDPTYSSPNRASVTGQPGGKGRRWGMGKHLAESRFEKELLRGECLLHQPEILCGQIQKPPSDFGSSLANESLFPTACPAIH